MRLEVPVLVVGAGPVGLMAAMLLRRQGIDCHVIERRTEPQRAPAAHVVNARTFEICRAVGVDMAAIDAASTPPADAGHVRWVSTLVGEELGCLPFERQGEDLSDLTPTPLRSLSQHRFEPILLDTLQRLGGDVAWGHTWESAEPDADGVTSVIRHGEHTHEVRSRWVLAADGAGSRVRKSLGIDLIGPPRLQSFVMIHFEANLRGLVAHRPAVLYWTTHPEATGTFVAHDIDSTWVYMHPWDPDGEAVGDYTPDACGTIVRRALGTDAVPFTIRTISPWTMSAQVADRYRVDRIFLLGDSAHRFPPTGGMGLNTGVQDAHNLMWKLVAVERGEADAGLLDTYESERRPVAQANADVSLRNAMRLGEVYQALGDPTGPVALRTAIANQTEHFDLLGLQLGFTYADAPAPISLDAARDFVPSARVGARLPHAWVERDGKRCSTLDCCPLDRFTLVTTPHGAELWSTAVARLGNVPLDCLVVGRDVTDPDGRWTRLLDLESNGALLVRPDQHIAWRQTHTPSDPHAALAGALRTILGKDIA